MSNLTPKFTGSSPNSSAIHKPPAISSYDVIRTITPLLRESPLFRPLIERDGGGAGAGERDEKGWRRTKRKQKLRELKIGHGGTLDPLATGVLVVGIGNGTKSLQQFLGGTKEYVCDVLFGAATDSYDIGGKVVKTAGWEGVTKESVEKTLEGMKGEGMQMPPVFSAIRINGKHLYDYAREGLELPVIPKRPTVVHELELLEWMPPDKHNFELPSQEAAAEDRIIAERVNWPKSLLDKRKKEPADAEDDKNEPASRPAAGIDVASAPSADVAVSMASDTQVPPETETQPTTAASRPPAAKIRMVVSSGFYVRSLCHDLGIALGSVALMATLARTRQSGFKLGENVIEYEAFENGSEVWEPEVKKSLENWLAEHGQTVEPSPKENDGRDKRDGRDGSRERKPYGSGERRHQEQKSYAPKRRRNSSSDHEPVSRQRRNSSSGLD